MTAHIGIAACSSEGAALCYRTICTLAMERLGGHRHPEISVHTPPLQDYVDALSADNLNRVADLMLTSARKLAAAGADFVICPDNTIHAAFERMLPASPLPWLHIAEIVAAEAAGRGFTRPAILGTRWLTESQVYPSALSAVGLDWLVPDLSDRVEIDRIIMQELVAGRVEDASRSVLHEIVAGLAARGADCALLVCTELPLIILDGLTVPALDSTRLLAHAALDHALADKA